MLYNDLQHLNRSFQYLVADLLNEFFFYISRALDYWYSVWMIKNLWPIWIMLLFVFLCNTIRVHHFLYWFTLLLHSIPSFSHTRSLLLPYTSIHVSIKSFDYILLSSFEFKKIWSISLVKTLNLWNLKNL